MEDKRKITISVIQMSSTDKKEDNLAKAEELIDIAAKKGSNVIVLPEMFNFFGIDEEKRANAESIPGPTIERMRKKAIQHSVYLLCGSILEKTETSDKLFNTSVFLNPTGAIIATYRKIHLFDVHIKGGPCYQESKMIRPGEEVVVAATEIGNFGLSICYDLRFPELYRKLTFKGAEVIFLPAAFTLHTGKDHWEPLIKARAIENQVFIVAAAQLGSLPGNYIAYGRSMIVDPWGVVLATAPDQETAFCVEIDLDYQSKVRAALPSLQHIRQDLFCL